MTWCCLFLAYFLRFEAVRFKSRIIFHTWIGPNRPFAANHSRGTKPPCWRVKVALGQDKQRKLITTSHCLCVLFVLSQCDFCSPARRFCTTWMASCKGPILTLDGQKEVVLACNKKKSKKSNQLALFYYMYNKYFFGSQNTCIFDPKIWSDRS